MAKSKKTPGPKEAELRHMREGTSSHPQLDHHAIREQLAALEEKQRLEREEKLHGLMGPLEEQIKFHEDALDGLLKIKADLTGKPQDGQPKTKGKRMTSEEKLKQFGQPLFDFISKGKKEGYLSADLAHLTGTYSPNEIRLLWNAKNPDKKIILEGEKAAAKYVLA